MTVEPLVTSAMAENTIPSAAAVAAAFDNSSMWRNFTMWTVQHLAFLNMTRLTPSLEDLAQAGPRMVSKLGKLNFFGSDPVIDDFGQRVIPDTAGASFAFHSTPSILSSAALPSASVADMAGTSASTSRFSLESARGLGSVFSYATSKWALCTIAMAVVLNRTHIFAATRRRRRLAFPVRLLLRILPVVLFVMQARSLLQSMQCQTSTNFSEMRWGNSSKSSDLLFSHSNAFLHGISSSMLLRPTDREACEAVNMIPSADMSELRGSLSLLWPLFGTFCLSQFIEHLSCAVQGRPVVAETWMTLFEHSLAFAEADAAISNQLGWGLFTSAAANATSSAKAGGANIAISRAMIMKRVNTPPEVLLIALISTLSHITSHVLGIFNLQSKFRLINTGVWAVSFMGSIIWSIATFSLDDLASQGLLRFPTVCIIGFIPHVLVLVGIVVCCFIYGIAIGISSLAQTDGEQRYNWRERVARAHDNMQANVSLGDIRINMEMDFYTALLRAGFGAITMASEAVYLNEDRRVNLKPTTWLEDDRFREFEEIRVHWSGTGIPGSRFDGIGAIGLVPVLDAPLMANNGFARERAAQKVSKGKSGDRAARPVRDGVGAAERSSRWLMAIEYGFYVNRLMITTTAIYMCQMLAYIGVRNPPRWLRWLAQRPKLARGDERPKAGEDGGPEPTAYDWIVSYANTAVQIPRRDDVDVEHELRRRIKVYGDAHQVLLDKDTDHRLYDWFLKGGWFGSKDASGDYDPEPDELDDDLTSIISESDAASIADSNAWESDSDDLDEGQRTPTQASQRHREATPTAFADLLPTADLARLLDPQSPEERDEARALAAHLSSPGIMTRASYRAHTKRKRGQLLFSTRPSQANKMTPDEEEEVLEQLLLSRRQANHADGEGDASWATGAAGLGPEGPQCVVCHSSPRTVIVWPCRCLSLCDDCRVALAMNNFDKCVCCRREVVSFSRIFVP